LGYLCPVAVDARIRRSQASRARGHPIAGLTLPQWPPQWSAEAWGAIAVTALCLGISAWWVIQDHSIPISDAGFHLAVAIEVFKELQSGQLHQALGPHVVYPPLVYLASAMGAFVGGLNIPSFVIAEDLFFVPLLALGCYQIGKLAFGSRAGLLAVIFALGSPLVPKLFHMIMLDAPNAAMVSVSVWLILATRYFTRLRYCAVAGLAVGLGMLTKEPFALFVAGVLAVTFLRGGWRQWRGLAVFGVVLLVVAGRWYIADLAQVKSIGTSVTIEPGTSSTNPIAPPRLSSQNFQWYLWSFINLQLYLPLFLLAAVGWVWTLVGFVRRRWVSPFAPELAVGAFVAWLALTETFVHDNRYSVPMLVYLAVFGTFWIVRLGRRGRIAVTAALVLVAIVNTLGGSFGVGGNWAISLPRSIQAGGQPNTAAVYSSDGYLESAAPETGSDMLGTLRRLKRGGVVAILVLPSEAPNEGAFVEGILALTSIADLSLNVSTAPPDLGVGVAVLDREPLGKDSAPPCVKLSDGTGVWIRLGNPNVPGAKDYCPSHKPPFYIK
jgi:hypothetical protein